MEATIQPKYVNPPKGNGKSWSVKDANGDYWGCTQEVANYIKDMQAQGAAVVVTYETRDYQGKTYKNIKSAAASSQPAARPAQQSGGGYDEAQKAEDIFISGAVNQSIAAQQIAVPNADLRAWTHFLTVLRQAWRASKAPVSAQTVANTMRNPDPNDELPPFA